MDTGGHLALHQAVGTNRAPHYWRQFQYTQCEPVLDSCWSVAAFPWMVFTEDTCIGSCEHSHISSKSFTILCHETPLWGEWRYNALLSHSAGHMTLHITSSNVLVRQNCFHDSSAIQLHMRWKNHLTRVSNPWSHMWEVFASTAVAITSFYWHV